MYRDRFGVEPICRTLGVSASAYYQRASERRSARAVDDERLLARIEELHAANYYAYGYRRMWKALLRAGEPVGRDRVKRLMRLWRPGRQAARHAVAHHDPGSQRHAAAGPRQPQLQRRSPRSTVGRGLLLFALLGGRGVLQLRHRRLLAPHRGLAVHQPQAHRPGARRAADGAGHPGSRRRRRSRAPFRRRQSARTQPVLATPGHWSANRSG